MSLDDLFNAATGLGKLGIVGILALGVILIGTGFFFEMVVPGRTHRRELKREMDRADRNLEGWEDATKQFERSLDVIERMQGRRRATDEARA